MAISHAAILLFDGFESLDAFGPFEVLAAGGQRAGFDVSLVTAEPAETVESANGAVVVPDGTVADIDPDLLVVPGGGWNDRSGTGTWAEAERGTIPELLAERDSSGTTVAGVCTGGMLLSRAGLLDGRPAVTHEGALADLHETDAEVTEARVVDAGAVVTAGGVTAGIDLALHLLEREYDAELADDVAAYIEYERRGPVHVTD